jgi:hypothetical protein
MKNRRLSWLMLLLVVLVLLGVQTHPATSNYSGQFHQDKQIMINQQAAQTPIPTELPPSSETPELRVLPSVGGNAGLVLGATVLVLIIIGGVILSSRWRGKH